MVYGVLKLLNFAHGDVYMVGAYIGYFVIQWFGGPTALAIPVPLLIVLMLLIAGLGVGLLGVAIERFAYRPLRDAPRIAPLITALGVSFVLENTVLLLFGGFARSYSHRHFISHDERNPHRRRADRQRGDHDHRRPHRPPAARARCSSSTARRSASRCGAVASDREAAEMLGINVNRTIALTFFIGSVLAGFAGVMSGLEFESISNTIGFLAGLKAFTAAVVGGIGSITGAMVGGILDRHVRGVQPQLHLDEVLRPDRVRDPDRRRCSSGPRGIFGRRALQKV